MEKRQIARKIRKIIRLQNKVDVLVDKLDTKIANFPYQDDVELAYDHLILISDDIRDALCNVDDAQAVLNEEIYALLHNICAERNVDITRENG